MGRSRTRRAQSKPDSTRISSSRWISPTCSGFSARVTRSTNAKPSIRRDIVVIGGSAGAITALRELLAALPAPFPAAIVVVVHISPDSPPLLAKSLARSARLPIVSAQDGMKLEPDRVIVGMPDLHLTIVDESVRLT